MLAAEVCALLQDGLHLAVMLHIPVDARLPHQHCTTLNTACEVVASSVTAATSSTSNAMTKFTSLPLKKKTTFSLGTV